MFPEPIPLAQKVSKQKIVPFHYQSGVWTILFYPVCFRNFYKLSSLLHRQLIFAHFF